MAFSSSAIWPDREARLLRRQLQRTQQRLVLRPQPDDLVRLADSSSSGPTNGKVPCSADL